MDRTDITFPGAPADPAVGGIQRKAKKTSHFAINNINTQYIIYLQQHEKTHNHLDLQQAIKSNRISPRDHSLSHFQPVCGQRKLQVGSTATPCHEYHRQ